MIEDYGHWKLLTENVDSLPFGFIYKITNNINNRIYIGKKQMSKNQKRPPLKGKKKSRRVISESDWKTYMGSCTQLLDDINSYGKDNFTFEIVQWCSCKWELAYYEAYYQFMQGVLLSDQFYNGIINLRIGKKPKSVNIQISSDKFR